MEPSSSPSAIRSGNNKGGVLVVTLHLHAMLFMGLLAAARTQMTKQKQSAFDINGKGVFMIIAVVSLVAAGSVTSGIFFCTKQLSSKMPNYYTILASIDIFLAYVSSFSLMMVLDLPNWIPDLVMCVIAVVTVAYGCTNASHDDDDESPSVYSFTYLGLVLVPLCLVLVLFVPANLNWIVYSGICLSLGMDFMYISIIFFKLITQNLEAWIQQDKNNNDLEAQHDDKNNNNDFHVIQTTTTVRLDASK